MAKRIKRLGEMVRWNAVNGIREGAVIGVTVIYTVDTGKGVVKVDAKSDLLEDTTDK